MLAPAYATTEMFFFLLLLPLEIPGHYMPPQSLSVTSILQIRPRFLVLRCEVEIDCTNGHFNS